MPAPEPSVPPERSERGARAKRSELVRRIADVLLAQGVAQAPLRELGAALGTSDRMLLYYFDDKADLVASSLQEVSARLAGILEASAPPRTRDAAEMLRATLLLLGSVEVAPFMAVWADVAARSARREEPFRSLAARSVANWLGWIAERLDIRDEPERGRAALTILAVVEGARLIGASWPGATDAIVQVCSEGLGQARSGVGAAKP